MTRWRRSALVEARADLVLSDQASAKAYALHFEAQMRQGALRRLLYAGCVRFARAGAHLGRAGPWLIE
jgi:hypothetical protein